MELTNAAVHDRIADLNALATELRLTRETRETRETRGTHSTAAQAHPADRRPVRPTVRLGDWLIGIGTALGGDLADAGHRAGR